MLCRSAHLRVVVTVHGYTTIMTHIAVLGLAMVIFVGVVRGTSTYTVCSRLIANCKYSDYNPQYHMSMTTKLETAVKNAKALHLTA